MLAVLAAVFTLLTVSVLAGEVQPYGETAFKAATSAGKTVLLDFHADWCPVCRKQGPLLESLAQEDKLKNVVVLKVDYDDERALEKQLKILSQSTLVVFKGEKEVARATGVTDKDKIRELIEKGL
jgi:thioredoxin